MCITLIYYFQMTGQVTMDNHHSTAMLSRLGCLRVDHKLSNIADLEVAYLSEHRVASFVSSCLKSDEISEFNTISTCNRMEYYFVADDIPAAAESLMRKLADFRGNSLKTLRSILHLSQGEDVLHHLFNVTAGVESMVLGENEIITQVKDALKRGIDLNISGPFLNKVFNCAIASGKRVRSETLINKGAHSVSSLSIDVIQQLRPDFLDHTILVVGTGVMGRRVLKKLQSMGHSKLWVTNRTASKAFALQKEIKCNVFPYDSYKSHMNQFDVVVMATSSSGYILYPGDFDLSESSPLLIVDLGVPRNVDPVIGRRDGTTLLTVTGLQHIVAQNLDERKKSLAHVNGIIQDELTKLYQWESYRSRALEFA